MFGTHPCVEQKKGIEILALKQKKKNATKDITCTYSFNAFHVSSLFLTLSAPTSWLVAHDYY